MENFGGFGPKAPYILVVKGESSQFFELLSLVLFKLIERFVALLRFTNDFTRASLGHKDKSRSASENVGGTDRINEATGFDFLLIFRQLSKLISKPLCLM